MLNKRPMMPNAGEKESEFMGRCIAHYEEKGKPHDQAVAICMSEFKGEKSADKGEQRLATIEPAQEQDVNIVMINRYTVGGTTLTRADVEIRSMYLCNDQIDSYDSRFTLEALNQIVDLIPGQPVLTGHDYESLPVARYFKAELENKASVNWVRAWFYWLKGVDGSADMARNIDGGIWREVSIGWRYSKDTCSICGKSIRECEHAPGQTYAGKKCYYEMSDIEKVLEGSLVFSGGQNNTHMAGERLAARDAGADNNKTKGSDIEMTPEQIKELENAARIAGIADTEARLAKEKSDLVAEATRLKTENEKLVSEKLSNRKTADLAFVSGTGLSPAALESLRLPELLGKLSDDAAAEFKRVFGELAKLGKKGLLEVPTGEFAAIDGEVSAGRGGELTDEARADRAFPPQIQKGGGK